MLSHMRTQCIYQHCSLPYEKITGPVQHHGRLLIDTFYGHKVHIRARNSLTNRLGVCNIVLLWLPPLMQEAFQPNGRVIERVLLSGLFIAAFQEATGRDGDLRIGSISFA